VPLAEQSRAIDATGDEASPVEIASCGKPVPGTHIRITDDAGKELTEDHVGHIEVRGPSVMKGYFGDVADDPSAAAIRDWWLDTGDLGYLRAGALRVTGRRKELVIVRGNKYSPSEFEWAAAEVEGVYQSNAVALGLFDRSEGSEILCLVCETDLADSSARAALEREIRSHVSMRTGVVPTLVELVPRNAIPRTSSGKVQRDRMKSMFLALRSGPPLAGG
jgi:acyl-CoA synthetase (AMP-forming)/AMP-acid ligase II